MRLRLGPACTRAASLCAFRRRRLRVTSCIERFARILPNVGKPPKIKALEDAASTRTRYPIQPHTSEIREPAAGTPRGVGYILEEDDVLNWTLWSGRVVRGRILSGMSTLTRSLRYRRGNSTLNLSQSGSAGIVDPEGPVREEDNRRV